MSTKPPAESPAKESTGSKFGRQIDEAFEEAARLAGSSLPPTDFYDKLLNRTISAIDAPAGAVWLRTPQGFLQIASQINLDKVGLDGKRGGRQCHNEVLRQVFQAQPARPLMVAPQERLNGLVEPGPVPAANLTEYYTLFAPIVNQEKQALGLLEVFQEASHDPRAYPTFLNYTVQMAGYASQYHLFTGARQSAGVDKVVTQVEAFARLVHGTLNPTEAAYHVANEGRRLVECDRLCVGVRHGKKVTVEAVSGADVVEKASTHVRRMRRLFDAVLQWGDKLVFKGARDESLPPAVLHALDDYLAESQPKLLVVAPVRDEREKDEKRPARSILLLESFNPPENVEPMVQRLEVVGKHAAPALYNAAEMKSIPLKTLWWPVKKVQDGLGGRGRLITAAVLLSLVALTAAMVFVPYPLKMEAKGQLQPFERAQGYAPVEGSVRAILFNPGDRVPPNTNVVALYSDELRRKLAEMDGEINTRQGQLTALTQQLSQATNIPEDQLITLRSQLAGHESFVRTRTAYRELFIATYNMDPTRPGWYFAKSPRFDPRPGRTGREAWTVLNSDVREPLLNRTVRPSEPLIHLGNRDGEWHVELKLPQSNMGHILTAYGDPNLHKVETGKDGRPRKYLDVDLLLTSDSDHKRQGRLYEDQITAQAVPNRDDHNESESVVVAYVKINLDDFPADRKVPGELFVNGQEVHARVRCGDHALGYSLFHGVWEWFYEKVIFPF